MTGVVYFDFGTDRKFPAAGWNDFVIVILNWWFAALGQLSQGEKKVDLRFMDGPYWITAIAKGRDLILRCIEDRRGAGEPYEVVVGLEDLRSELMSFAYRLSSACTRANISSDELVQLRKYLPN